MCQEESLYCYGYLPERWKYFSSQFCHQVTAGTGRLATQASETTDTVAFQLSLLLNVIYFKKKLNQNFNN